MSEHKQQQTLEYRQDSIGDRAVLRQVFEDQCYALDQRPPLQQVAWLRTWLESVHDPLIIDAGANIGASAVYFATAYPNATVVAIEPEPNNYALLEKNAAQRPTIRPLRGALSCSNDTLFVHDPGRGDWGFTVSSEPSEHPIQAFDMHMLLRMYPGTPFICKCDIEGSEARVFKRDTFWISKFPLLIVELHDWMLPGQGTSHNLLRALSMGCNFDVVLRGEDLWCFNLDLLRS